MSSAAAVPDWLQVNNSASDTGINAAPRAGPGPGPWSREYCRGPGRYSETSCVTLSCCDSCSLSCLHHWLGLGMCEARALDDNWDTERDGLRAGAATSLAPAPTRSIEYEQYYRYETKWLTSNNSATMNDTNSDLWRLLQSGMENDLTFERLWSLSKLLPEFLIKSLPPLRAAPSLSPASKCIKETQTELGNKFDFWFQFYHVWTGEALILNKLFISSLFSFLVVLKSLS